MPSLLIALASTVAVIVYSETTAPPALPQVTLMRTPHDGIQPQALLDRRGVLHMIYFKGNPSAGDIEYVRRDPGAKDFSAPIRVNSQPGSAVAIGTVRGPQMALGRGGRICVIWFGSGQAKPRGLAGMTPVLFSHLDDSGTAFVTQRNLMQYTKGVDGGLSIAAGQHGDVYAVWHAMGEVPGEAHRRVYLARSTDNGKTFTREVSVSPASLGACGCCGMRAFVDARGTLYVLYRAAAGNIHRDMTLLVSTDRGHSFRTAHVSSWKLNACPMSTDYLSEGGGRVLAAWEKAGEVYFDEINPRTLILSSTLAAPGSSGDRKHPAATANSRGQVLLAWTEGTAWMKGGSVAWQLFDAAGQPVGQEGHASGVPVWGLPSVFANRQGNFTIVY
ncbi:MAG: sialidase family protein [Terriglobia bacterium]